MIEQLLSELYEADPSLRAKEDVLQPLLHEMIAARPDAPLDPNFRSNLKRQLRTVTGPRGAMMRVPFWVYFPLAGAIVVLLLFVSTDHPTITGPIAIDESSPPEISTGEPGSDTMKLSAPAPVTISMNITSEAFENGESIPERYTCKGEGVVPPLSWSGVPENATSLALVLHDIDAPREGGFTHWVVYDIPPDAQQVKGIDGDNGRGTTGYIGPCPPSGTHQYVFTLYALDAQLGLKEGASRDAFLVAAEGHILSQAELVGLYSAN